MVLYSDYENFRYKSDDKQPPFPERLEDEQIRMLLEKYKEEEDIEKKIEIRNEIVLKNSRYVNYYAKNISQLTGASYKELSSYGYEGLIIAIERYDINSKTFPTYIGKYIRGYMLQGIPNIFDFYSRRLYYILKDIKEEIERSYGKKFNSYKEISDEILNGYLEQNKDSGVDEFKSVSKVTFNIPEYLSDHIEDEVFACSEEIEETVLESVCKEQLKNSINNALESLSETHRFIINNMFGLSGEKPKSLREIAGVCGVSHEFVRKKSKEALRVLSNNEELISNKNISDKEIFSKQEQEKRKGKQIVKKKLKKS